MPLRSRYHTDLPNQERFETEGQLADFSKPAVKYDAAG